MSLHPTLTAVMRTVYVRGFTGHTVIHRESFSPNDFRNELVQSPFQGLELLPSADEWCALPTHCLECSGRNASLVYPFCQLRISRNSNGCRCCEEACRTVSLAERKSREWADNFSEIRWIISMYFVIVTLVKRLDYLEKREQRMFVHSVDFHFAEYVERRLEVIARPDVTNSIVKFFFIAWLLL